MFSLFEGKPVPKRPIGTVQHTQSVSSHMSLLIHSISPTLLADLHAAKNALSSRFLGGPRASAFRAFAATSPRPDQNVVGVGIAEKIDDGKHTGILAVKFFVRRKYTESELTKKDFLPKSIDGLPVDVEQAGTFRAFPARAGAGAGKRPSQQADVEIPNPKIRFRPAQPGSSIGFRDPTDRFVMAGTFGAVVKDRDGTYLLSNNHVLADEGKLASGAPIFQPGLLDNGNKNSDQIAELARFIPIQAGALNKVDAATAEGTSASTFSKDILHIGPPAGTAKAGLDMRVHKFGRTTSYTVGIITSVATDVKVDYEAGSMTFQDQIIIVGDQGAFSAAGDSGSLILDRQTQNAVGLLFAGSASHTIANHLEEVLQALGVTLA